VTRAVLLLAAMAAAGLVAACGRGGAPELPPEAAAVDFVPVDPTDPDGDEAPDRSFVLDPILQ